MSIRLRQDFTRELAAHRGGEADEAAVRADLDTTPGFAHWVWWRIFHAGACPACHRRLDHHPCCWERPA